MDRPEISVVVATRNRPGSVRQLVESLARQTLDRARFEVVIVDDCSEPPLADLAVDGLEPKLLRHDSSRGPAAARNTGWRASAAPLVAFTDDDCEATPGWLEALLTRADARRDLIVQGPTEPVAPEAVRPLSRTLELKDYTGLFETCNVLYPRDVLERIGGFDESFRNACGEDVDLGMRALDSGADSTFEVEARVLHAVDQPTLRQTLRGTWKWTDAPRIMAMYPRLRPILVAGLFWKKTHPELLLAAVGVAMAMGTRRPAYSLLAAPYVNHYRRAYPGDARGAARALPAHLAIDAFEVVTMAAGSVKHRTLML